MKKCLKHWLGTSTNSTSWVLLKFMNYSKKYQFLQQSHLIHFFPELIVLTPTLSNFKNSEWFFICQIFIDIKTIKFHTANLKNLVSIIFFEKFQDNSQIKRCTHLFLTTTRKYETAPLTLTCELSYKDSLKIKLIQEF